MVSVFLSYCHDNQQQVARLRQDLLAAGVGNVWWDQDIRSGQQIYVSIREAMREVDHVIVCFSEETQQRDRTGIYPEVLDAIQNVRERPPNTNFLIPIRLSKCEIPDFEINATTTLKNLRHIDLFPSWEKGLLQLLRAIGANLPTSPAQWRSVAFPALLAGGIHVLGIGAWANTPHLRLISSSAISGKHSPNCDRQDDGTGRIFFGGSDRPS